MAIPLIGSLGTLNQSAALALESQRYMGDRMVALGQSIGTTIAERQAYADAQTAAPFIQRSFEEAYNDIESGNPARGVAKAMGVAAQFQSNPLLARFTQEGIRMAGQILNNTTAKYQIDAVTGRSQSRIDLQTSKQAQQLQSMIANAEAGLNDPDLPEQDKERLRQQVQAAKQYLGDLTSGQGAQTEVMEEDVIMAPGEERALGDGLEGPLPTEDGMIEEIQLEPPPQGAAASEDAMAWAKEYRNPQVWNRLTQQQKAQVDRYIGDVFDAEDIDMLNSSENVVAYGFENEDIPTGGTDARQTQQPTVQGEDGLARTPLNIPSDIMGGQVTFAQRPTAASRNVSVGPQGYSSSTSVRQAQMPQEVIKYQESINEGLSRLPTEATDIFRQFGGITNFDLDVSGTGDTRTLKVRPKGSSGKPVPVQTRDANGFLQDIQITAEDAKSIDGMESAINNLVSLRSATDGYAVEFKSNEQGAKGFFAKYAESVTPTESLPFNLPSGEILQRLGISDTRADENTKKAITAGIWSIYDKLGQDQGFRTLVTEDPNKAINQLRKEIQSGDSPQAKRLRNLIPGQEQAKETEVSPSVFDDILPEDVASIKVETPLEATIKKGKEAVGQVATAVKETASKITEKSRKRVKISDDYERAKAKLIEARSTGRLSEDRFKTLRKKLDEQRRSELGKL